MHRFASTQQKSYTITKRNDNINIDSKMSESVNDYSFVDIQ